MESTEEFSIKAERADKNMKRFEISRPGNDKSDDNEQKSPRKKPRFSPITHADQPSPSAVHEKEWVQLKGEKSAYSDVSIEDVINLKEQKNLTEVMDKANKIISEVRSKKWDNESIIKNILVDKDHAEYAHQCFEKFNNQLWKCIDLNTKQYDKKDVKQILTTIKDLNGNYGKAILVKQFIELEQARKDLKASSNSQAAEAVKDLSRKLDELAKVVFRKELDRAKKLSLKMEMNNWDKSTIEKIVEDKSYAEYAHQCFHEFNNQLKEWMHLVKGEETTQQHDEKTTKQLLAALKDLTDHYNEVTTVKHVIELAQARKCFKEKGDHEAARSVRKALEKFEPPQHLRKMLTAYWLNKSINEVNDELMCKILDEVVDCEKNQSKNKIGKFINVLLNMINYNKYNNYIDDLVVIFKIENTTVQFGKLREKWSQKEWFSKLDDRQMLDNGQIKEIMEEYYKSYLNAVDKRVQDLVQEGDPQIWIRCQPKTLVKILKEGRFKSQFETGTSGGTLDEERRKDSEYCGAGIPRKMPVPFRFIYGYASSNPDGKHCNVGQYGLIAVRLKSELKEFALQMLGDSLYNSDSTNLRGRPTFFDNADRRCVLLLDKYNILAIQGREYLDQEREAVTFEDSDKKILDFHEVQIPAVYKEDIQEIVFHTRMHENQLLKDELTELLKQNKIPYRWA